MKTRTRRPLVLITALIAGALALSGCAGSGAGEKVEVNNGKTKVNLILNWTPLADHAPYFLAKANGLYDDAGLDVNIEFGKGSADSAQRVATGQSDIAVSDTGSVVAASGMGAELLVVGMLFDKGPQAIWTTNASGITEPADLVGKKVGVPNGDTQKVLFPALAKANDFDASKVDFVNIAPTAKYGALSSNQVDAILDFTTGQPFVEKAVGADNAVVIPWADHGVNLYGNALVTTNKYAEVNADVLKKFLKATYTAWRETMEDPDAAIATMKKAVPEVDVPTFTANLTLVLDLFKSTHYAENGIGYMNEDRMCETVETVQEYVPVESKPECTDLYTNDYLTKVELPASMETTG